MTDLNKSAYWFIHDQVKKGKSPRLCDIADEMGISSFGASYHVQALKKLKFIKRDKKGNLILTAKKVK